MRNIIIDERTGLNEPSNHQRALTFSDVQKNQITVSWLKIETFYTLLIVKKAGTPLINILPDGTIFNANSIFGSGDAIPNQTDTYACYYGEATQVTITNLLANTSYGFRVVAVSNPLVSPNYKNTGTAVLNPRSISTLA